MNGNAELLNFVFQNSQMGVETLEQLMAIVEEQGFKDYLKKEYDGYRKIHEEARKLLNDNGYDEKGLNAFEKIRTYLMINMKTMTDRTSSNIAEMLIVGSNMGITDAIKNIRKYQGAEKKILDLMEKLKKFEESNVEKLKEFL